MKEHSYLIVGGGMSAAAAVEGIRTEDENADIGILSREDEKPYDRPPLSKGLWTGDADLEGIWRELPEGVRHYPGSAVGAVDPTMKKVTDTSGESYRYEKLLLATGGRPRRLDFGKDDIIYYRRLSDYRRLRNLSQDHEAFAVIGAGFIGSEIAAALAMQGKRVTMIYPQEYVADHMFPADLAADLSDLYKERGVELLPGEKAAGLEGLGTDLTLKTESGQALQVNAVVAGIGIAPNVELAENAGLTVDNGIVVNERLQSSDGYIYAAGDVANYPDQKMGMRRRVEHENAANSMGRTAGRAMAGAQVAYDHSPMFYSDLFDRGYEAVGRLDASMETVSDWEEPFKKGVVYYLEDGRVRGVLLWNTWGKVDEATELLAEQGPFNEQDLKGRI
ncbi:MAG: NAD(P)/FAD-dependent oxidoreductase [Anaerolineales bacterium]